MAVETKLKDASEILAQVKKVEDNQLQPLYKKFKENYAIYTFKPFKLSGTEGLYDDVTSNEFGVHGRKVQGLLSAGRPTFSFKLDNEKYQTRKDKLSTTERFIYSAISKADKLLLSSANNTSVHGATTFYVVHFGGCIPRVCVWEDEEGNPVFDVALWQPWNVTWGYGSKGLSWACNKRWASVDEAKELYPDANVTEDTTYKGYVQIYDYWDSDRTGIIINQSWASENKDGEHGAPYEHGIGHVPLGIFTAGDIPMMQIDDSGIEQAVKWYSCYDGMRPIMDVTNKLLTYRMTLSQKAANRPMFGYYKGGTVPETPTTSPDIAGGFTWLDEDKGQRIEPSDPIELTRTTELLEAQFAGLRSMGGLSPIAYGQPAGTSTATGIAMLMEANSSYLNPFKGCIEQAEQFIATELVRQTKAGKYKTIEADGFDGTNKRFSVDVVPAELEDEKEVICKLEMTSVVQNIQNAGIAVQLTDKELISRQTAQDVLLGGIVQDTDAEQERIAQERIRRGYPEIDLLLSLEALIEDRKGSKDEVLKSILLKLIEEVKMRAQPKPPQMPGQAGLPEGVNPEASVAGIQQPLEVPQAVSNAIRTQEALGGGI